MSRRWKMVVLIGGIISAALVGRVVLGDRFEPRHLIDGLRQIQSSALALPGFLLLFGVATALFTPAAALMLTAGVVWGFWPGWVVAWVAANLWSNAQFAVGRFLAREQATAWLTKAGATGLMRELEAGGVLSTVMVRQLPLPFLLVNVGAGASPVKASRWLLGNAIGLLPNALVYTQFASALVDGVDGVKADVALRVMLSAGGVLALSLVLRFALKRWRFTSRAGHPETPP